MYPSVNAMRSLKPNSANAYKPIRRIPASEAEFDKSLNKHFNDEKKQDFEYTEATKATEAEKKADELLQKLRMSDAQKIQKWEEWPGAFGAKHRRFIGDKFMYNKDFIEQESDVFKVLKLMPKASHLHLHFNASINQNFLVHKAIEFEGLMVKQGSKTHMCIRALKPRDPRVPAVKFDAIALTEPKALWEAEIQFKVMTKAEAPANIFLAEYGKLKNDAKPEDGVAPNQGWMVLDGFLKKYKETYTKFVAAAKVPLIKADDGKLQAPASFKIESGYTVYGDPEEYFSQKLRLDVDEMYHPHQSDKDCWIKFNARTRFMKGLFNYKYAFVSYTKALLEHFVKENIQYAEIRPNFMKTNNLMEDDGTTVIQNAGIMDLIIQTFEKFQKENDPPLVGLKVIYCFPRSLPNPMVAAALDECLKFKKDPKYANYIAGFDLVGEENAGKPLSAFKKEFIKWGNDCAAAKVQIPLLLHCGETRDIGSETDSNVAFALALGAERIAHGLALAHHPAAIQKVKEQGVCVELCLISNELLSLVHDVRSHPMYSLLAQNVACTISCDNESLFDASLTHEFYQAFVGRQNMSIWGLKQLALWSIEHSILMNKEKDDYRKMWLEKWRMFVDGVNRDFGGGKEEKGEKGPKGPNNEKETKNTGASNTFSQASKKILKCGLQIRHQSWPKKSGE